ncbi:heterokaryon incompatibility protein-domain-containing protein [Coniochaeta sp. 2T2.1]|nr:heterokaryon incompatibility protein-domain-containing protein [Coniochaeta sp. 2T2.1]
MRLLSVDTLELTTRHDAEHAPRYAILSHTWGDEEVTFQDLQTPAGRLMKEFRKILACCKQARKDGIKWVWIDTCCIDKTSSAELSEAINSMFNWYFRAAVCYTLLEDVPPRNPHFPEAEFRKARWFTRGWCLQELIAPDNVEFYSANWTDIGTKWSLQPLITEVTGIPEHALRYYHLENYSVAQMSWASTRKTTRDEDMAYCLLGIFGINIPLLYGEGRNAFLRLQREILTQNEDYSFLLWTDWTYWTNDRHRDMLCAEHGEQCSPHHSPWAVLTTNPSLFGRLGPALPTGEQCQWEEIKLPHDFEGTRGWKPLPIQGPRKPHQLTSRGLYVHMLARKQPPDSTDTHESQSTLWTGYMYRGMCLCISLTLNRAGTSWTYGRSQPNQVNLVDAAEIGTFQLTELYLTTNGDFFTPRRRFLSISERKDLMVVLSSKRQSTVNFVESSPPIQFFDHLLWIRDEAPWDAKRLYCLNLQPAKNYVEAPLAFSLTFRVCIKESIDITTEADVVVTLWVEESLPPRCCISLRSGPGEATRAAAVMDAAGVDNVNNGDYGRSSDRAYCQLPNNSGVIGAMVKGCREPPMKYDRITRRRNPAFCTLYVADLGNGLSNVEESSTGGDSDSVWDLDGKWEPDSGTEESSEVSSKEADTS